MACDFSGVAVGYNEPGVSIGIFNSTNESYENAILRIGVMVDEEFVETESLVIPTIPKSSAKFSERTCYDSYCLLNFKQRGGGVLLSMIEEDNWNPDSVPINSLSNKYYFLFQLEDGASELIEGYEIPDSGEIRVEIQINIESEGLSSWKAFVNEYD